MRQNTRRKGKDECLTLSKIAINRYDLERKCLQRLNVTRVVFQVEERHAHECTQSNALKDMPNKLGISSGHVVDRAWDENSRLGKYTRSLPAHRLLYNVDTSIVGCMSIMTGSVVVACRFG